MRRESTDLDDFFIAHIGGMDCYARGLRIAAKMIEDDVLPGMVRDRYSTFDSGLGAKLDPMSGSSTTLADFAEFATAQGEPVKRSGKQELYENIFMEYVARD